MFQAETFWVIAAVEIGFATLIILACRWVSARDMGEPKNWYLLNYLTNHGAMGSIWFLGFGQIGYFGYHLYGQSASQRIETWTTAWPLITVSLLILAAAFAEFRRLERTIGVRPNLFGILGCGLPRPD